MNFCPEHNNIIDSCVFCKAAKTLLKYEAHSSVQDLINKELDEMKLSK